MIRKWAVGLVILAGCLFTASLLFFATASEGDAPVSMNTADDYGALYVTDADGDGISDIVMLWDAEALTGAEGTVSALTDRLGNVFSVTGAPIATGYRSVTFQNGVADSCLNVENAASDQGMTVEIVLDYHPFDSTGSYWYNVFVSGLGGNLRYYTVDGVWNRTYYDYSARNLFIELDGTGENTPWLRAQAGTIAHIAAVTAIGTDGKMNVTAYRDGTAIAGQTYDGAQSGRNVRLFGKNGGYACIAADISAIRLYRKPLNAAQMLQNHFADLARDCGLDVSAVLTSRDTTVLKALYNRFAETPIGGIRTVEMQTIVDNILMTNGMADDLPLGDCITFEGFQSRLRDYAAVRALFTVNMAEIARLESRGMTVECGTVIAPESTYPDALPGINAGADADVTVYYQNGAWVTPSVREDGEGDPQIAAMRRYDGEEDAFLMRAYLTVTDPSAGTHTTVYYDTETVLFGRGASVTEAASYFLFAGYTRSSVLQNLTSPETVLAAIAAEDDIRTATNAYRQAADALTAAAAYARIAQRYAAQCADASAQITPEMSRATALTVGAEAETGRVNALRYAGLVQTLLVQIRQQKVTLDEAIPVIEATARGAVPASSGTAAAEAAATAATHTARLLSDNIQTRTEAMEPKDSAMAELIAWFDGYTANQTADAAVGKSSVTLKLNGTMLDGYLILANTEAEPTAVALRTYIYSRFGICLPVCPPDGTVDAPAILLDVADDDLTKGQYRIRTAGNTVLLEGGCTDDLAAAVGTFVLTYATGTGDTLEKTVPAEATAESYTGMNALNLPETCATPLTVTSAGGLGTFEMFCQAVAELPDEVTVLAPIAVSDTLSARDTVFVANDGDDRAAGTVDAPLATIQAAVDRMQYRGGGVIYLRGGTYMVDKAIMLDQTHSGTVTTPLVICRYRDEEVLITMATPITGDRFSPVTDAAILSRLDENVRDKVRQVNLAELGITAYGSPENSYLYVNHSQQPLARYPDLGTTLGYTSAAHMNIVRFAYVTASTGAFGAGDSLPGWEFGLPDDEPLSWQWEDDIWIYGTPYMEWDKGAYPLSAINREAKTMSSTRTCKNGVAYTRDNYLFFFNVLEELNAPGEWYLDDKTGILYYYPEAGVNLSDCIIHYVSGDATVSGIVLTETRNVIIDGLTLRSLQTAVTATSCRNVRIQRCTVSNTGSYGIEIKNSKAVAVIGCDCSYTNQPMVNIDAPAVPDLVTPDRNAVQSCYFHGVNPDAPRGGAGVYMTGTGSVVSHNMFDRVTISAHGTECIYEYNIVEGGSGQSYDWGPIYLGGGCNRHGQHVRYNVFRNLSYNLYGIYLDGMASGHYVYGNIVHYAEDNSGMTRGVNVHGGRGNVVYNNIVIGAGYFGVGEPDNLADTSFWFSQVRAYMSFSDMFADKTVAGRYPRYTAFYHALERFRAEIGDATNINQIKDVAWSTELSSPSENVYLNNALIDCGRTDSDGVLLCAGSRNTLNMGNFVLRDRAAAGFTDCEGGNFMLSPDSPVYRAIPDFIPIRCDLAGIPGDAVPEDTVPEDSVLEATGE